MEVTECERMAGEDVEPLHGRRRYLWADTSLLCFSLFLLFGADVTLLLKETRNSNHFVPSGQVDRKGDAPDLSSCVEAEWLPRQSVFFRQWQQAVDFF